MGLFQSITYTLWTFVVLAGSLSVIALVATTIAVLWRLLRPWKSSLPDYPENREWHR